MWSSSGLLFQTRDETFDKMLATQGGATGDSGEKS